MKTILIATDFSTNSRHAAIYGYQLAQQLKAKIILSHVQNIPAEIPQAEFVGWPSDVLESIEQDGTDELVQLKRRMIAKGDPKQYQPEIICSQSPGLVSEVLNEEAEANQADMILTGLHGNDTLGTLMVGNHASKMINGASRPLLLVPASIDPKPVHKIAFGCDLNKLEKDSLVIAKIVDLAKTLAADLTVVHVDPQGDAALSGSKGRRFVEELISKFDYTKITFTIVKSEDVESGLNALVGREKIDMLALLHREHNFFKRLFSSSNTHRTARYIPVPLLVFRQIQN